MIVCQGGSDTIVQIAFSYAYSSKFAVRIGMGVYRDDSPTIWREWSYYTGSES